MMMLLLLLLRSPLHQTLEENVLTNELDAKHSCANTKEPKAKCPYSLFPSQLSYPVWPDWAIYWTLGNFLKPLAKINLPKSLKFLGNFCIAIIFLVKSFLGNFYRHLAIFYWSHCSYPTYWLFGCYVIINAYEPSPDLPQPATCSSSSCNILTILGSQLRPKQGEKTTQE